MTQILIQIDCLLPLTNHENFAHRDDLRAAEHVGHDLGDHGGAHAPRVHHRAVAGVQDGLALK